MTSYFDEKSYYEAKAEADPDTRFWRNPDGARKRYDALLDALSLRGRSVLDFGCGSGDFLQRAKDRHVQPASYHGLDIVPGFVDQARKSHPESTFITGDILDTSIALPQADWCIAIGLFGHNQPETIWRERFIQTVRRMWALCETGIGFTLTSTASPNRNPDAYYADPDVIVSLVRSLFTQHMLFDHRYLPNDFLIVARKQIT